MGVPGLWKLLEPARNSIDLSDIHGKVVAIDMNIWLHQAVKSRGTNYNVKHYLAIFFRRLCKLLYFGIQPVFVFDGDVPFLKRFTMDSRRTLRSSMKVKAERAQKCLIRRLLKRVAEAELKSAGSSPVKQFEKNQHKKFVNFKQRSIQSEILKRLNQQPDVLQAKDDLKLFSAPSNTPVDDKTKHDFMPSSFSGAKRLLNENAGMEYDDVTSTFLECARLSDVDADRPFGLDLESDTFKSLPLAAQLNVIEKARNQTAFHNHKACHHSTDLYQRLLSDEKTLDAESFSSSQVQRLLSRHQLAKRGLELSNQLTRQEALNQFKTFDSEISTILESGSLEQALETNQATALRIQSQDQGHTLLIKMSPLKPKAVAVQSEEMNLDDSTSVDLDTTVDVDSSETSSVTEDQAVVAHRMVNQESVIYEPQLYSTTSHVSHEKDIVMITDQEPSPIIDTISTNESQRRDSTTSHVSHEKDIVMMIDQEPSPIIDTISTNESQRRDSTTSVMQTEVSISDSSDDDDFVEVPSIETAKETVVPSDDDLIEVSESELTQTEDQMKNSCDEDTEQPVVEEEDFDDDYELAVDDDALRESADRLSRQAQTTTNQCIREAQELLRLFGMPFVLSPEEAEAQCVALQHAGLVDLVASDDSDVWPFGVTSVCRHLFGGYESLRTTSKRNVKSHSSPNIYTLEDVKSKLGLNWPNLVRLSLLCGSDYTRGVSQVGPVTGVEILSEFNRTIDRDSDVSLSKSLEQKDCELEEEMMQALLKPLKDFNTWWNEVAADKLNDCQIRANSVRRRWINLKPPPDFPDARIARAYLKPNVSTKLDTFQWKSPSVSLLISYAKSVLDWKPEQTRAMFDALFKRKVQATLGSPQSTTLITQYFQAVPSRTVESSEVNEINLPSKRARHATKRLCTKSEPIVKVAIKDDDCESNTAQVKKQRRQPRHSEGNSVFR